MYNIKGIEQLQARVQALEQQKTTEWKNIKRRVNDQYEALKPANIIHNAFASMADTINTDSDLLKEGAALASGMLVNSIMGSSKNKPLKRWVTLIVFSVASYFIARHRDDIVEAGNKVVDFVSDRLKKAKTNRAERKRRKEAEAEEDEDYPGFAEEDTDVAMP